MQVQDAAGILSTVRNNYNLMHVCKQGPARRLALRSE